jgi:hypothetical protein
MSLIQEALKRKTEEQKRQPGIPPAPQKPEPPPPPPEPVEKGNAVRGKKPVLFVIILLLLLTAAAGYYLVMRRPRPAQAPLPIAPQPVQIPVAPPPAAPQAPPAPAPEPEPVKKPEPKPEIQWPELRFPGSAAGGSQVLAIINGRMLAVGDRIQDVSVLQIGKTEVLVEYKGEKRILQVDNQ